MFTAKYGGFSFGPFKSMAQVKAWKKTYDLADEMVHLAILTEPSALTIMTRSIPGFPKLSPENAPSSTTSSTKSTGKGTD